jgi:multicomponent K+:H+ antiporter subunit D
LNALVQHLPAVPIVVPLVAGALMLLLTEAQRTARVMLALTSLLVQLAVAIVLLYSTTDAVPDFWTEGIGVYSIGGWPAPFGIVLVVDRLSGMMLTLSATIALAVLIYSLASWDRPGQPFYALYQFLTMGLNGAFLTGDLFNLFVFFEVLLAASYGLMLRGLGAQRVARGLHYIAANLAASLLFLIGVAVIYGTVGTLNMAELFSKVAALPASERTLFDAGAALLGIAFLVKAGAWPLNFWLPGAYSVAIAPVAAVFAMLTKVGIYAVLRVGTLMSQDQAAASMLGSILFFLGLATLVSGMIGMLATQRLTRLVAYSVIVSSGVLLASLGLGIEAVTAPVLFYLSASVLTTGAFFMLTGMTDRTRLWSSAPPLDEPPPASTASAAIATPSYVSFGVLEPDAYGTGEEVGVSIPAAIAFLGLMFVCCVLLVTGMPPLPGFIAKFTLLASALAAAPAAGVAGQAWALTIAVLATGFAAVIALTRIGIRLFWAGTARRKPRLRVLEAAPVAFLVMLCLLLSAFSGPVMTFFEATASSLHDPQTYIRTVLSSAPHVPSGEPEP